MLQQFLKKLQWLMTASYIGGVKLPTVGKMRRKDLFYIQNIPRKSYA
jgi:hypothetical protein